MSHIMSGYSYRWLNLSFCPWWVCRLYLPLWHVESFQNLYKQLYTGYRFQFWLISKLRNVVVEAKSHIWCFWGCWKGPVTSDQILDFIFLFIYCPVLLAWLLWFGALPVSCPNTPCWMDLQNVYFSVRISLIPLWENTLWFCLCGYISSRPY